MIYAIIVYPYSNNVKTLQFPGFIKILNQIDVKSRYLDSYKREYIELERYKGGRSANLSDFPHSINRRFASAYGRFYLPALDHTYTAHNRALHKFSVTMPFHGRYGTSRLLLDSVHHMPALLRRDVYTS